MRVALRDHLARFPGGVTVLYAQSKLEALMWAGLGSDADIPVLQAFLSEFPKSEHADEARRRIGDLQKRAAAANEAERLRIEETEAWSRVSTTNDVAVIEEFLEIYPRGQHAASAYSRIRELRSATTASLRSTAVGIGFSVLTIIVAIVADQLAMVLKGMQVHPIGYALFHGTSITLLVWLAALLSNVRNPQALVGLAAGSIGAYVFEVLAWPLVHDQTIAMHMGQSLVFAACAAISMPAFRNVWSLVALGAAGAISGQLTQSFGYPLKIFIWEALLVAVTSIVLASSTIKAIQAK